MTAAAQPQSGFGPPHSGDRFHMFVYMFLNHFLMGEDAIRQCLDMECKVQKPDAQRDAVF